MANDNNNDGKGTFIEGPWKSLGESMKDKDDSEGTVIEGPWKSLEDIAGERQKEEEMERKMLEENLLEREREYGSYRNKIGTAVALALFGSVGLMDLLTDLHPIVYAGALYGTVVLTQFITKQKRTLLREYGAYIRAEIGRRK